MKTFENDNSGNLFNHLVVSHGMKNDRALSEALGIKQPLISKIRNGVKPVSAETILRTHEKFGIPVKQIRALINKESA